MFGQLHQIKAAGGGGGPDAVINNSWRAWDSSSFTNGGNSCNDVINGLTLGPYGQSGNPSAFFYGSYSIHVAGSKYWAYEWYWWLPR